MSTGSPSSSIDADVVAKSSMVAPLSLDFVAPALWSTRTLLVGGGLGLALHYGLERWLANPAEGFALPPMIFALLGAVAAFLWRKARLPRAISPIVFFEKTLSLPLSAESSEVVALDYKDILSIDILGRSGKEELIIATSKRLYVYPLTAFATERRLQSVPSVLRQRLVLRPDGASLIAAMEERQRIAYFAFRRVPRVTHGLLAVLTGVFLFETLGHAVEQPLTMLSFGANAPLLVQSGQWYRLITGNFLHQHIVHLGFNALALYSLGGVLESVLGSSRFFVLYVLTAVAGAGASALYSQGLFSVGASTAMFGLLAALLYLNIRSYSSLPTGIRQTRRFWVFVLGVNFAVTFLVPVVDVAGHLGGFVAGFVLMALFCLPWRRIVVLPSTQLQRVFAFALGVLTLFAAFEAAQRARQHPQQDVKILLSSLENKPEVPAVLLNDLAMAVAVDHTADPSVVSLAQRMIERALAEQPNEPAFIDTLASVRFRQGAVAEAIQLEEKALALVDTGFLWAQLARFLSAAPPEVVLNADKKRFDLRAHVDGSFALQVNASLQNDVGPDGVLALLVIEEEVEAKRTPRATIRVRIGRGASLPAELELAREATEGISEHALVRLVRLDPRDCRCGEGGLSAEVDAYPAEVARYPGPLAP